LWHPLGIVAAETSDGGNRWQHDTKAAPSKIIEAVFERNRTITEYDARKRGELPELKYLGLTAVAR
jgi:hypothetical protein